MPTRNKILIVVLSVAIAAFLLFPGGPVGMMLWPPHPHGPTFEGAALAALIGGAIVQSFIMGLGVAFLLWGMPLVRRLGWGSSRGNIAAYLSLAYVLTTWPIHDGIHIVYGESAGAILATTLLFHVGVAVAGAVLLWFGWQAAQHRSEATAETAAEVATT